jgi:hypothetical protein
MSWQLKRKQSPGDDLYRVLRGSSAVALLFLLIACSSTPAPREEQSPAGGPFNALLTLYRGPLNHLSAVRHGQCPMYPSCSQYAKQAIAKHGEAIGWAMAMDRLMRCGRDEINRVPKIWVNGTLKYYDPVEANDFWWADTGGNPPGDEKTAGRAR